VISHGFMVALVRHASVRMSGFEVPGGNPKWRARRRINIKVAKSLFRLPNDAPGRNKGHWLSRLSKTFPTVAGT
jgi:hypothetical protein